ncbi:SpoIIIJ-associated RNA/ssDNA-binding protein Jag [[Clostridium] sordellii]|uniref:RNA-binding cell elongation regulator Jag/EloR n=1 Tax=Paraclostridium sordellii TaxID=1505 RepID=UPI0005E68D78|nr:RNA-binding cell elongation regulator Jag/EloR [Paeniclostridium sordellii]MDU6115355.1 RNA-binding cell elongation regulator Jag/EloR [Paeniclostridium sordellii]RGX10686.1 protein jag [Paeniclostridium sordellii]CEN92208.1 SpoIIIJ-associated RNA/ssDNA-binding protein Jag [[Clostridium] sordellii] [Paeniclostridium sordellii]
MKQSLEIRSKNIDEAISKALRQFSVSKDDIEVEVIKEPTKGFLGLIGSKDGIFKITVKEKEEIVEESVVIETETIVKIEDTNKVTEVDVVRGFISNIINNLNLDANIDVTQEKNTVKVNIKGKDAACLIGRRGESLDSIQFLAGLALNKSNKDSHSKVLVDIENYRSKREESLIRYANKVAREVAKTRRTKKLDYMNPYERRIIHSTLQNDKFVKTYSEGVDPYRRLVIEYKK